MGRIFGSRHTFEEFSLGGLPAATMDSSIMQQRWSMAALPTGTELGRAIQAWRVAFPSRVTFYAEGASLGYDIDELGRWYRMLGVETRFTLPQVPVSFSPAIQTRVGVGFSVDRPLKEQFRAYRTFAGCRVVCTSRPFAWAVDGWQAERLPRWSGPGLTACRRPFPSRCRSARGSRRC